MGIFDRFENAVERGVNGAFSRVFRSGIKAVDVTSALKVTTGLHGYFTVSITIGWGEVAAWGYVEALSKCVSPPVCYIN